MIIGVCGIDGCGKTTLVKKIHEMTNAPIVHAMSFSNRLRDKSTPLAQFLIAFDRLLQYTKIFILSKILGKDVVLDRCVVDAMAYTKVYGGGFWADFCTKVGMRIAKPDLVFWLDRPVEWCWENIKGRHKDSYLSIDDLYKLREAFQEIYETSDMDILKF